MTNREWMESLPNDKLALFLCATLPLHYANVEEYDLFDGVKIQTHYTLGLKDIASRYIQGFLGIESWLAAPQEFELVE